MSTRRRSSARKSLSPAMLDQVADRFKALAEPTRLSLLQALKEGERAVGDLVLETATSLANASKQLQQLHAAGFVTRRKEGLFVYYRLADPDVLALCDLVCGRVLRETQAAQRALQAS